MKRRNAMMVIAGFCLPISSAWAQSQERLPLDQMRPYIQVKTVPGDEFTVRAFFSPTCAYSKQYYPFFKNLSRTLPQGQQFEFTPLVNKLDGLPFPMAFYAVRRYYPAYLANFMEAAFQGVQVLGLSPKNWAAIDRIGKAARIPTSVPKLVQDHLTEIQREIDAAIERQGKMKITNTPTISVAGTYTVTPEFTGGDAEQFSNLVNGVISMASLR